MVKRQMKYNPAFLSEDELVESFVVRGADLDMIVEIVRDNTGDSNQHLLVIGPRGIGKTMLALRVAAEVHRTPELNAKWYPLVFAEESYEVVSPGEFWLEAIFHLGKQTQDDRWKRTHAELNQEQDEFRLRERALDQLLDFADEQGKRILIIVENFNQLLGEQISDKDAWTLRHTLMNEPRIMLLATAVSRFDEIDNSGKAMFELFKLHDVKPLDEDECRIIWKANTGSEPGDRRIRPIQILTGGSPRLLTIISNFGKDMSFRELMDDLVQLVDDHTEYFKSHLEALPVKERKAYLGLAELWDASTAHEVAEVVRLDVNAASALLKRLTDFRGAVVSTKGKGERKRYQVAERMYNIYYLMRRRGTPAARVKAVVNFMVDFYDAEGLVRIARIINSPPRHQGTKIYSFPRSSVGTSNDTGFEREMEEESAYMKAIELEPDNEKAWINLGALYDQLERYESAREVWSRVVKLNPDNGDAWLNLGVLYHTHLEIYGYAEKAYKKALKLKPGSEYILTQLVSMQLDKQGHPDKALKQVKWYLKKNDGSAELLMSVAELFWVHDAKTYLADIRKWVKDAVKKAPDNSRYQYRLAWILVKSERYTDALESARRYLEDEEYVKENVDEAIELFVELAAKGKDKKMLKLFDDCPSARYIEPLIVGLRMFFGEEVHAAVEIVEVGKDVVKRIRGFVVS